MALNLFELAARITLDKKDFDEKLPKAESAASRAAKNISGALKGITLASGAAAAAGATAFGGMAKSALSASGELEQGLGGAKQVYGDYLDFITEKSQNAAQAAGLSATQYLATANKMGALLQGSGYSPMDAAQTVTDAMQRAADVASIMGISVEDAMTAVTGAMKGNFTMMDNLGVAINDTTIKAYAKQKGMSKKAIEDMNTMEKIGLAMEIFFKNTEYAIGNYEEENKTFSGSLATLKAEWNNFLSGGGGQNNPERLAGSVESAMDIIIKNLGDIVPRLTKQGGDIIKRVGAKLPDLMKKLQPMIETGAKGLLTLLQETLPYLIDTTINLAPSIISMIVSLLPSAISGLGKLAVGIAKKAPEILKKLWESIKSGAKSLAGLVFGTDAKGEVKWPTWEDVEKSAKDAWEKIKAKAKTLGNDFGKLLFGTNEKGEVKWPTWDDVVKDARQAWKDIKDAAKTLGTEFGKIVFGTNEKGEVKWPTWNDVAASAEKAWGDIVTFAGNLGTTFAKIIFGTTEKGDVKWPTPEEIRNSAAEAWDKIVAWARNLPSTFGRLVFGTKENGDVNWPDPAEIKDSFDKWWQNKARPAIEGAAVWTLKLFGVPQEKAEAVATKITGWWDKVKGSAENALDWTIKLFNAPDPHSAGEAVRQIISNWWEGIRNIAQSVLDWNIGVFGIEDADGTQTANTIGTWWEDKVKPLLGSIIDFGLGALGLPSQEELAQKFEEAKQEIETYIIAPLREFFDKHIQPIIDKLNAAVQWVRDLLGISESDRNANAASGQTMYENLDNLYRQGKIGEAMALYGTDAYKAFEQAKIAAGNGELDASALEEYYIKLGDIAEAAGLTAEEIEAGATKSAEAAQAAIADTQSDLNALAGDYYATIHVETDEMPYTRFQRRKNVTGVADESTMNVGSNAIGSNYVPYDNYLAQLHRGEMVLTRQQANAYRSGESGGVGGLAAIVESAITRGMERAHIAMSLDGAEVARNTNRRQADDIAARRFAPA